MRCARSAVWSLLISFFAPMAWGADLGGSYTPYGSGFSWSGLYIGANVGYGWSQVDWQDAVTSSNSANQTGSGWLAGAQIGYNWQWHQLVFGVEADASGAWVSASTSCQGSNFTCGHTYDWLASARGRIGYAFNGNRTLIYGTAGLAWADIAYATTDPTGAMSGTGFSQNAFGWVAGAGIEHMLTQKLSVRLEYLYYGFPGASAPASALGPDPVTLTSRMQEVRLGVNIKF